MKQTRAEKLTIYDVSITLSNTIFFGLPLFLYLIYNFNGHLSLLTIVVLGLFTILGGFAYYRTIGKWHRAFLWFYFIHLIIFPFLYSYIQINFPENFLINDKVNATEAINNYHKVDEIYEPKKLILSNLLINKILKGKSFKNRTVEEVQEAPLVTDSIVLSITSENYGEQLRRKITFSDLNGKKAASLSTLYLSDDGRLQIGAYLRNLLKTDYELLKKYNEEVSAIDKRKFWDFNSIFPYALNIFNTENIRAQSRFANIFLAIHQLIFLILVTLLCASFYDNFKGEGVKRNSRNRIYSRINKKLKQVTTKLFL